MLKVLHLPCFAKPVFGAFSPRADKAPSHIIRALRLFTLREERHRLRVHAKPGRCWTSPFLWRKLAEPATTVSATSCRPAQHSSPGTTRTSQTS